MHLFVLFCISFIYLLLFIWQLLTFLCLVEENGDGEVSEEEDDDDDDDDEEEDDDDDEEDEDYGVSISQRSPKKQKVAPVTQTPNKTPNNKGRGKGNRKSRALSSVDVSDCNFASGGELRRKFHCSHCGKSFKTKSHLQRHILTHTGEKPYHCNRCGSKFNQSSSLRNHIIAIHTKEYPHYCPTCSKGFLMPALLQKHLATSHRVK